MAYALVLLLSALGAWSGQDAFAIASTVAVGLRADEPQLAAEGEGLEGGGGDGSGGAIASSIVVAAVINMPVMVLDGLRQDFALCVLLIVLVRLGRKRYVPHRTNTMRWAKAHHRLIIRRAAGSAPCCGSSTLRTWRWLRLDRMPIRCTLSHARVHRARTTLSANSGAAVAQDDVTKLTAFSPRARTASNVINRASSQSEATSGMKRAHSVVTPPLRCSALPCALS